MRLRRVLWFAAACALCWHAPGVRADPLPAFRTIRLRLSGLVTGVRVVDCNRDGRTDLLVVADRRVLVFLQRADGFPAWADVVRAVPRGTILADVWVPPGGGAPQVLCIDRRGVRALRWEGTGFAKKAPRILKRKTAWRAPPGAPVLVRPIIRDLTGDGRDDLLVPVPDGYAIYELPAGPGRAGPTLHAQLQVDVATRVALLDQSRGRAIYAEAFHPPLTAGDADGDGQLDIVVHERNRLAIHHRDAAGRLPRHPTRVLDKSTAPRTKKPRFDFPMPLTVADVTGDGILDYVQAIPGDGTVLVFGGSAARTDFAKPDAVIRTSGYALGALPRDLDGDGRLDLLVGTIDRIGIMGALQIFVTKSLTVHSLIYYNRGTADAAERFAGSPDDERAVNVPLAFTTTREGFRVGSSVVVSFDGDFDGDGRRDMLQRLSADALGIWRGRASRGYASEPDRRVRVPTSEGYRFVIPIIAELDGDGRSDLILHYRDWEDQENAVVVLLTGKRG